MAVMDGNEDSCRSALVEYPVSCVETKTTAERNIYIEKSGVAEKEEWNHHEYDSMFGLAKRKGPPPRQRTKNYNQFSKFTFFPNLDLNFNHKKEVFFTSHSKLLILVLEPLKQTLFLLHHTAQRKALIIIANLVLSAEDLLGISASQRREEISEHLSKAGSKGRHKESLAIRIFTAEQCKKRWSAISGKQLQVGQRVDRRMTPLNCRLTRVEIYLPGDSFTPRRLDGGLVQNLRINLFAKRSHRVASIRFEIPRPTISGTVKEQELVEVDTHLLKILIKAAYDSPRARFAMVRKQSAKATINTVKSRDHFFP
ncbi:hypothetical protein LXL04_022067 [Taraxacum kok-saghyz]